MAEESKVCTVCHQLKPLSEFHFRKERDTQRADCIQCYRNYQVNYYVDYRNTMNGRFSIIVNSAKRAAKRRGQRGRSEASIFEITSKDIQELYKSQEGRCFYSGIKMNLDKNEWKISIERLDTTKGYIRSNIVLCCLEVNTRSQWSESRIKEMLHIIDNDNHEPIIVDFYTLPKRKEPTKRVKSVIDGIEHYNCSICNLMFPHTEFCPSSISSGCKKCRQAHQIQKCSTSRSILMHFISTTRRAILLKEKRDLEHNIDFEYLVTVFNQQNGRCAYSGMPLCFGYNYKETFWKISIERIDVMKGYVKGNVCFVCLPFNGTDFTSMMKDKTNGNGGWNKEKFQYFLKHVRDKYNVLQANTIQEVQPTTTTKLHLNFIKN